MAVIFLEPSGSGFAGGVAGGYPRANSTDRSQTAWAYGVGVKAKDVSGNEYTQVKAGASIAATDLVIVNHKSAGTAGAYLLSVAAVGAGSCAITVFNNTAAPLSEAIVLSYAVIKGVAA